MVMKVCKDLCVGLGGVLGISYDASKEQFICIPVIEEEEEGPKRIEGTVDQELEEDLKAEEVHVWRGWLCTQLYMYVYLPFHSG